MEVVLYSPNNSKGKRDLLTPSFTHTKTGSNIFNKFLIVSIIFIGGIITGFLVNKQFLTNAPNFYSAGDKCICNNSPIMTLHNTSKPTQMIHENAISAIERPLMPNVTDIKRKEKVCCNATDGWGYNYHTNSCYRVSYLQIFIQYVPKFMSNF
jgi:hypothetical protein